MKKERDDIMQDMVKELNHYQQNGSLIIFFGDGVLSIFFFEFLIFFLSYKIFVVAFSQTRYYSYTLCIHRYNQKVIVCPRITTKRGNTLVGAEDLLS